MFCGNKVYSKTEKIHHQTLKVIYNECKVSVSIHQRYLRFLLTQVHKLYPKWILNSCGRFLPTKLPCNLRKGSICTLPRFNSIHYGTNVVYFRETLIWNNITAVIKSSNPCDFKWKSKNHEDINCWCLMRQLFCNL